MAVARHVEAGLIPGHSPEQLEAIQVLEDTAQELALHMVLAVGDIQFVADSAFPSSVFNSQPRLILSTRLSRPNRLCRLSTTSPSTTPLEAVAGDSDK